MVNARSKDAFVDATNNSYDSGKIAELDVFSHGYSGGISLGGEDGDFEQEMDYDQREINSNTVGEIDIKNFTQNAVIDVNACNVGNGFAQELSNITGKKVKAFTGPVEFQTNKNGTVNVVPTYEDKDKKTFDPQ